MKTEKNDLMTFRPNETGPCVTEPIPLEVLPSPTIQITTYIQPAETINYLDELDELARQIEQKLFMLSLAWPLHPLAEPHSPFMFNCLAMQLLNQLENILSADRKTQPLFINTITNFRPLKKVSSANSVAAAKHKPCCLAAVTASKKPVTRITVNKTAANPSNIVRCRRLCQFYKNMAALLSIPGPEVKYVSYCL